MIIRPIEQKLRDIVFPNNSNINPSSVIIIEGARQVGKTSLLEKVLDNCPDVLAFNLEDRQDLRALIDQTTRFEEFQLILENHIGFDTKKKQILFVDEAQESSQIGTYVRFMKEKWLNTKVILTGSSMSRLFRKNQRIPVGRFIKYLISPFSFREFLICLNRQSLLEQINNFDTEKPPSELVHTEFLAHIDRYIEVGGLPEVVTYYSEGKDWVRLRASILSAQADDFARKSDFENPLDFLNALRGVANNLGFPAKYNHLNENTTTAKNLAQVLQDWHLIYEIEQKGNSSTTNFFPKRYIYDLGIAQTLRNMPFPSLSMMSTSNSVMRTQLGGVFENLVLSQLVSNSLELPMLSGWKKNAQDGVEIDFILKNPQLIPIEVKASKKISLNNFKSIISYLHASNLKTGIIISNDMFRVFKRDGLVLINLPIYLAEKEIIQNVAKLLR